MSDMTAEDRMFPIMVPREERRAYVPWTVFDGRNQQAFKNHSQDLERLAERGGLSACEAMALIENRRYRKMDQVEAWRQLIAVIEQAAAARAREEEREAHEVTRRDLDAALALIDSNIDWFRRMSSADGSGHGDLADRTEEKRTAIRARNEGGGE